MNEAIFKNFLIEKCGYRKLHDPSHDLLHVDRVVRLADKLCQIEMANREIVLPAAYLHDCVLVEKTHPDRKIASTLSAKKASQFLSEIGYKETLIEQISHAILAHSYSAQIIPETLEAKIVQDADRLDALGIVGLLRMFTVGARGERLFYHPEDPFYNGEREDHSQAVNLEKRQLDDSLYTLDHFYVKLSKLPEQMNTQSASDEAHRRLKSMQSILSDFEGEIFMSNLFSIK